jgi:uncharacterized protein YbjT (DUF2867 family)
MGKKIYLLTSATGNLGSNIARTLISKSETLRALVRNPSKARVQKGVEISQGDVLDVSSLEIGTWGQF